MQLDNPNRIYFLNDGIGFVSVVDRMKTDVALKVINSARISYSKTKFEVDDKDQLPCELKADDKEECMSFPGVPSQGTACGPPHGPDEHLALY